LPSGTATTIGAVSLAVVTNCHETTIARYLRYFLDHPNEVVSRETLLNHVGGYDPSAFTRTVDTHMARLRQKIEPVPAESKHLITVHRVGYKFVP